MVIDFINPNNQVSYNIKFAKIFGVYSAIYIGFLMKVNYWAESDGYIKLDRKQIEELTQVDFETQSKVEENLCEYSILSIKGSKSNDDLHRYKLNYELLEDIACSDYSEVESKLTARAVKKPKGLTKAEYISLQLKKALKTEDQQSRDNFEKWIDEAKEKFGYVTKQNVTFMETSLIEYCNGSVNKLREISEILLRYVYKEPSWVIQRYEQVQGNTKSQFVLNDVSNEETEENLEMLRNYDGEMF